MAIPCYTCQTHCTTPSGLPLDRSTDVQQVHLAIWPLTMARLESPLGSRCTPSHGEGHSLSRRHIWRHSIIALVTRSSDTWAVVILKNPTGGYQNKNIQNFFKCCLASIRILWRADQFRFLFQRHGFNQDLPAVDHLWGLLWLYNGQRSLVILAYLSYIML